jgi:hypothetical protein
MLARGDDGGNKRLRKNEKKILTFSTQNSFLFTKGNKMSPIFLVALNREYLGGKPQGLVRFCQICILSLLCPFLGEGTYKVPYQTILKAMRRFGKEPFPVIFQDSKPDSEAAKSGWFFNSFHQKTLADCQSLFLPLV